MDSSTGLIIMGHGTKDQRGRLEFLRFVAALRFFLGQEGIKQDRICYAYLEAAKPDLVQSMERLLMVGVQHIVIAPLFLASAGHMKKDIPMLLQECQAVHPYVTFSLLESFGVDAHVKQALLDRFQPYKKQTEAVILVCRGSSDVAAYENARTIAADLCEALSGRSVVAASLYGAGTKLDQALSTLYEQGYRKITILPLLLFHGLLLKTIADMVANFQERDHDVTVDVTEYLGVHPALLTQKREQIVPMMRRDFHEVCQ